MKTSSTVATWAFCLSLLFTFGCASEPEKKIREESTAKAEVARVEAKALTIGLILVGPHNDRGYSQAQYEGGKYVEAKMGAKLIYLDKVNPAERPGLTIPQVVDDLLGKGADLIIAGSADMAEGIIEAASQHPDRVFIHASGDAAWTGKGPKNLGNVFGRMEYSKMMAGFTAAMTTRTGRIGVVGPLINAETRRLIVSAYLGAKYAWTQVRGKDAKDLTFDVKWIGFWFNIPGVTADPIEVAGSLVDSGCDVLLSDIDTPEVVTVARQRRAAGKIVWALPYDYRKGCEDQGNLCLGVPYFNWGPPFLRIAQQVQAGTYKPGFEWDAPYWADINDPDKSIVGFATGEGASDGTRAALKGFVTRLGSGELDLFTGPLNYQDGSVFLKDGEKGTDKHIWYMPQLLEGMEGLSSPK